MTYMIKIILLLMSHYLERCIPDKVHSIISYR